MNNDNWFEWEHISSHVRSPHTRELISFTEDTILFDGYFYIEDGAVPVERIFFTKDGYFHIEITEKKTLDDTSVYAPYSSIDETANDDDDFFGCGVCFFPTAMIELKYRLIKKIDFSNNEIYNIRERITQLEDEVQKRSKKCEDERLERERQEYLQEYLKQKKEKLD
jgi:hypothetical protein